MLEEKIEIKRKQHKKNHEGKSLRAYVMSEFGKKNSILTFWSGLFSRTLYQTCR